MPQLDTVLLARKKIKLIKNSGGSEIILEQGARVGYFYNKSYKIQIGILNLISDSSIRVDERTIQLKDIKAIGPKKIGTTAFAGLNVALAGFITGYFVLGNNNTSANRTIGGIAAASLIGWNWHINRKNLPKEIPKKWKLEIIE